MRDSLLMIRADGFKLPALTIFQEKNGVIPYRVIETLNLPANICIKANKSGYISEEILKNYLSLHMQRVKQLVILDSCTTHKSQNLMEFYKDKIIVPIVIPGGCTKYVQPLDSTVINSFKCKAVHDRMEYLAASSHKRSKKSGNLKTMDRQNLIKIVSKSWEEVTPEIITNSFKLTGIYGSNDQLFMRHHLDIKRELYKLKNYYSF